jgi:hypothetical protein
MTDEPNCYATHTHDEAGGRFAVQAKPHVVGVGPAPVLPLAPHDAGPQPGIEPPCPEGNLCGPVLGVALGGAGQPIPDVVCPYADSAGGCALVMHEIGPCVCFGGQA